MSCATGWMWEAKAGHGKGRMLRAKQQSPTRGASAHNAVFPRESPASGLAHQEGQRHSNLHFVSPLRRCEGGTQAQRSATMARAL